MYAFRSLIVKSQNTEIHATRFRVFVASYHLVPMDYKLTTLPNGLRVISEHMPSIQSAAIGCWVDTGSRDENPAEAGASHFLEHLLFKGSEDWSARRIAETLDGIGARHNAFTSKEYTCFWTRTRDADIPLGIEVLGEMLQRPSFRQDEIDSERHVVLEEINMNEDDPTDVAHGYGMATRSHHPFLVRPIRSTRCHAMSSPGIGAPATRHIRRL